ncbi:MAG: IS3 family transposase [Deltaproteobacteria bacterium]|nr:IS3 family transposase [Deltaproteobacteria bacterium]
MAQKRKHYSKQFKVDAVKLVTEQGYKVSEAARNLGIHHSSLRRWKNELETNSSQAFSGKGHMRPEKEDLHRLRKENKRLRMEREILKKAGGLLCQRVGVKFGFIRQQQKAYPVTVLCHVMGVSRSGYYKYLKTVHENKMDPDFELIAKVREIHSDTRGSYGSRRMSSQLRDDGYDVGRYRARSLMNKAGVSVKRRKKFKRTTDSNHNQPVAPNLLNRQFEAARPDTVWCADITYLWTLQGWLYLAVVLDLHSRKIVGWAMSNRLTAPLVKDALSMAYWRRKPEKGLIHHSDRGSQYAGNEYQKMLEQYGMVCSMSRKGDCWDNAVVESFFHSLKTEWIADIIYKTRDEARSDVIRYIEMFYNSHRLHSFLGYKNPNVFENTFSLARVA